MVLDELVFLLRRELGLAFDPRLQRSAIGDQVFLVLDQPLELLPLLLLAAKEVGPQLLLGDDPHQELRRLADVRPADIVVVGGFEAER